ncbi:MAG: cytochrome c3 family protein [Fidelibacterota bacterium]
MKKKFKRYFLIGGAGVIILAVVLVGTIEVTSTPKFCTTCHYMQPYVDAWKSSSHHDVTCTDCHFPPGIKNKVKGKFTALAMVANYMTGVYKKSKPWAEIDDSSCLREGCHVERILSGKIKFKEGIIFDHEPHLTKLRRNKKLRCTSCHSQIVQGEHISVTESTCFLCHFKKSELSQPISGCTQCHAAPVPTEAKPEVKYDHSYVLKQAIDCKKCHGEMQVGDGAVPVERCSSCHGEVEKISQYNNVEFIHKNHVTDHKVECQNCHLSIQHKSIARTSEIVPECRSCHDAEHIEQLTLFTGRDSHKDYQMPNPMFEAGLNCQACHIFHETTSSSGFDKVTVAKGESCERCHGKGYAKLFDRWESIMQEKLNLVGNCIDQVEKALESPGLSGKIIKEAEKPFREARYDYQLVNHGNVVHNVAFSDRLLVEASDQLHAATKLLGIEQCAPDLSVYSELVPSECVNCHYGQEQVIVNAFGITFSHDIHINTNKLPCSKCHSNREEHGQTIITRAECLNCHHTQEKVSCEYCHQTQAGFYQGTVNLTGDAEPDFMAQGEVDCLDCHSGEAEEPVIRPTGETCQNCHDEEYGDILAEWQDEVRSKIDQLTRLIDANNESLPAEEMAAIQDGLAKIKADGSQGVHNSEEIRNALNQYIQKLE